MIMRRFLTAALMAAFLMIGLSGCYTKLKGPEPGTGYQPHGYSDYYWYGYDGYWDYYYNYCYRGAWFNPYIFGYPGYYGYFYSPWWYDPWYGSDEVRSYDKSVRYRRSNTAPPPGGFSAPAPAPSNPSSGGVIISKPARSGGQEGGQRQSGGSRGSSGKSTRGRR